MAPVRGHPSGQFAREGSAFTQPPPPPPPLLPSLGRHYGVIDILRATLREHRSAREGHYLRGRAASNAKIETNFEKIRELT